MVQEKSWENHIILFKIFCGNPDNDPLTNNFRWAFPMRDLFIIFHTTQRIKSSHEISFKPQTIFMWYLSQILLQVRANFWILIQVAGLLDLPTLVSNDMLDSVWLAPCNLHKYIKVTMEQLPIFMHFYIYAYLLHFFIINPGKDI